MVLGRHMPPAEFLKWRIEARCGRLLRILRMIARRLEAQIVDEIIGGFAGRRDLDRKPSKIFARSCSRQIKGEKRLRVAAIGLDRKSILLLAHGCHVLSPIIERKIFIMRCLYAASRG